MAETIGQESTPDLQKILTEGGSIHFAPISGGILVLDKEGKPIEKAINMATFLKLQNEEKIKVDHSMGQGHPLFHGRVDIYKLPQQQTTA